MDLILRNGVIVTVNKGREIFYDGAMVVDKGRIVEVGHESEVMAKYTEADRVIDLEGKAVFPGLINTHNHLFPDTAQGSWR